MSKSNSRTSRRSTPASALLVLGLLGGTAATPVRAVAKAKPEPAAALDEDANDPCLQDGLCRAHYLRARTLSKDSQFDAALTAYDAAYRRRQVPWLLINIGRTLHKLGKPDQALEYYHRFRDEDKSPNASRLARLKEYADQAEADLAAAQKRPPATVKTPPPEPPNSPPPPSDVKPEPVIPPRPLPSDDKQPPALTPTPEPLAAPPTPPTPPDSSGSPRRGLWAGLGVSGGLLLVGGGLGVAALLSASQLHGTTYVGAMPSADSEIAALQRRVQGLALASDISFGAAAVSLGVTLAVTFLSKSSHRAPPPAAADRRPPPPPPSPHSVAPAATPPPAAAPAAPPVATPPPGAPTMTATPPAAGAAAPTSESPPAAAAPAASAPAAPGAATPAPASPEGAPSEGPPPPK